MSQRFPVKIKKIVALRGNGRASELLMPKTEFHLEWDPQKAATNARKHGIRFERAAIVFCDPEALSLYDGVHSQTEDQGQFLVGRKQLTG